MSETFVITSSKGPREWTGQFGPMHSYRVTVEGRDGELEIAQKPTSKPPQAGDTFTGTIEPPNRDGFPPKLKRAAQNGGYGAGPRPEDPARAKRIVRQHSQDMAIETLKLSHDLGIWPREDAPVTSVNAVVEAVRALANAYDKDAGVE